MPIIDLCARRIEYEYTVIAGSDAETIVFLHEGLGSTTMWKDFPYRVAHATNCNALVYSRYGYGNSDRLAEPRSVDYMHEEALESLPELLDKMQIERPVLFGHSDGASIALIHAGSGARAVEGLILLAPHVFVEDVSVDSIAQVKTQFQSTKLRSKLSRYHADVDSSFRGWNDIWLHPDFRAWNIEACLPDVECPILAIQGDEDEYGSMAQVEAVARHGRDVRQLRLADCRHSPHRDQTRAVVEAATRFVDRLRAARSRLAAEWPLPPYAYVPKGPHPHPTRDKQGHSYNRSRASPDSPEPRRWESSRPYLYGIDLFNHGYYWEAHEAWEALWHACGRRGTAADFLKALIALAAAGVKQIEGVEQGVRRHAERARELLEAVTGNLEADETRYLGLALDDLRRITQRLAAGKPVSSERLTLAAAPHSVSPS